MKVYQVRNGVMCEADAPDGALNLALNSTANPDGGAPLEPIVRISHGTGRFNRAGSDSIPIPAATFRADDLDWQPVSGGRATP